MDALLDSAYQIQQQFEDQLPPVDQWSPELSGDMDMRIDREGRWYHDGDQIHRESLVKLFSSILKQEGGEYFLVTPVEKWRIQVDVTPFVIVSCRQTEGKVLVTTNIGNELVVDDEHPITVTEDTNGQPLPKVQVQRGLDALIGRSVFYELVDSAEVEKAEDGREQLVIRSADSKFSLGFI